MDKALRPDIRQAGRQDSVPALADEKADPAMAAPKPVCQSQLHMICSCQSRCVA